ncbi:MAG TPA: bifunctional DNA-formamidopyrimidine glycosylase/DNA-(apurinic or apyrimidinic site) lyase [Phycisphaerae bacterium]|nr:bifunctional DNA-formamidopyrimidine glycosylase/DNA-(apurinic or apyrimidinic site) lyase [Phycisphaerae bacterium]
MPELPEVEEVRRSLEPHLLHIPIAAVRILRPDFLTPKRAHIQNLIGHHFTRAHRHGKKLFCIADDDQTLMIHLGMSGRVDCLPTADPLAKHTHIVISLRNATDIRLRDPRRFGGLWYYPSFAAAQSDQLHNLGPDALSAQPAHFAPWKKMRGRLKHRLLSQRDLAGLGNIYVDESLWLAKLHPLQRVDRIPPASIDALAKAIREVLNRSIRSGGTTLRDYRNVADQPGQFARQLLAYGRAGLPCARCGTPLKSALIAGRTTVFCPTCQRRH